MNTHRQTIDIHNSQADMSKRDLWLRELRDWNVDGQPGSGGYRPRRDIIEELANVCGLPFPPNGEQTKADWRDAVNRYFDEKGRV